MKHVGQAFIRLSEGYEGVTHAGVAVIRRDGGVSVLLAQRAYDETDDPAVRETWECPGGSLNPGEEPFAGAAREFEEELGFPLPEGTVVNGWRTPNGVYQGFVYEVDGFPSIIDWQPTDEVQAIGWFTPDEAKQLALRPEMRDFDWTLLDVSGNEDGKMDSMDSMDGMDSVDTVNSVDETTDGGLEPVQEPVQEPELTLLDLTTGPIPIHGVLAPEDMESGDSRGFNTGAVTRRDYRLPFMYQKAQTSGHDGAIPVGSVDRLMRKNNLIHWEGFLMPTSDAGEFAELLAFFGRYGVSVDGDRGNLDIEKTGGSGVVWYDAVRASGLTAVSIPAFAEAYVAFGPHPEMAEMDDAQFDVLTASGDAVQFKRGPGWVTNPRETKRIHDFWTKKGEPGYAKIRWGTPGDFTRAKKLIGEKIGANSPEDLKYLNQIIAQWHHDALGYWPGEANKPGNPTTEEIRRRYKHGLEAVITAAGTTNRPSLSYFHRPKGEFDALTILEPDELGFRRTFGYAAQWGVCFAGETEFITDEGVRTLKETVGTTQRVLASEAGFQSRPRNAMEFGGKWVDAEIRSFGVHPLMKVTLRRFGQTKEVYATKNHRWIGMPSAGKKNTTRKIITTENLTADTRLAPLYPRRVVTVAKGVRVSPFGVAHGFTFGDGHRYRDHSRVDLFGDKDKVMEPYFALNTSWPKVNPNGVSYTRVANLPAFFKELPSKGESLSYLYGWLAGYFAADGTVSFDGTAVLFSASREHLEFVETIGRRLGISTTGIRAFSRNGAGEYEGVPGKVSNTKVSTLYRTTFMASTLSDEFFINEEHRKRFQARTPDAKEYTAWHVVSVEETDRVEEVFCAVVPELENFTLEGNINVMNCHVGMGGRCTEPPRTYSDDYPQFHLGKTATQEGHIYTGVLTYGIGHRDAEQILSESPEQAYFDNIDHAWAAVRVGEDDTGIWFSGVVLPGIPEDHLTKIAASGQVSGEWLRGAMRACLTVNVPGFPVERPSAVYDDEGNVMALAASAFGGMEDAPCEPTPRERMQALAMADAEVRFQKLKKGWS